MIDERHFTILQFGMAINNIAKNKLNFICSLKRAITLTDAFDKIGNFPLHPMQIHK